MVSLPVLFYELNNVRREGGVMSDVLGNLHDIINNIDFQGELEYSLDGVRYFTKDIFPRTTSQVTISQAVASQRLG